MSQRLSKKETQQLKRLKSMQQKHYKELQQALSREILKVYSMWLNTQKAIATYIWESFKKAVARVTFKSVISLTGALRDNIPKIFGYKISPTRQAVITDQLVNVYRSRVSGFANDTAAGVRKAIDATFKAAAASKLNPEETMKLVGEKFKQLSTSKSKLGAHVMTAEITSQGNHSFAVEAGQKKKTWVYTYVAKKPRQHHLALGGTTIGINETFQVGSYTANYPHDNKLPIGEKANCHCVVMYSS